MQIDTGKSYAVKPRTEIVQKEDLDVPVESPMDFVALARYEVNISSYMIAQQLVGYFGILNGPTFEELVKDFWVRAKVYDREPTKLEEFQKIEEDENMKRNMREEKGLPEFTKTEIMSSVMGIPIIITEDIIGKASRCSNEGKFQWNLGKKISWVKTTAEVFDKDRPSDKFYDMQKEHRVLQKLVIDCFLQRGGGTDTMAINHSLSLFPDHV